MQLFATTLSGLTDLFLGAVLLLVSGALAATFGWVYQAGLGWLGL